MPTFRNSERWVAKGFSNDENGGAVFGEKHKLLDAVRLGYPIRIGWGSNRVEHVAEAEFLTIFQGKEVFAQIKTIIGQAPSIQNDSLKIKLRNENHWTKIAATNGYSNTLMTNYMNDSIVGGREGYTTTTWYVLYPNNSQNIQPIPLWNKNSSNWEEWKKNNE